MATKYEKPARPAKKMSVREVSPDEARARLRVNQEEYRALLQQAVTKHLELTCEDYREARLMAQRLTATRSFYGFEVKISHRGRAIVLQPREPPIDIESLPPGDPENENERPDFKRQIALQVEDKDKK